MRLLLQRVTRARVRVGTETIARIGAGLLVFVGVGHDDDAGVVDQMARRVSGLRIFRDEDGLTNRSVADIGGEILAVSQFTLYADTSRGRRPSFLGAAAPEVGERLYTRFCETLEGEGLRVARGRFGAEMEVELVNDGPMTIWLDSASRPAR